MSWIILVYKKFLLVISIYSNVHDLNETQNLSDFCF